MLKLCSIVVNRYFLSVLDNYYFDGPRKVFLDLYLTKFLDTLAKSSFRKSY